jgi:hypothetical protein
MLTPAQIIHNMNATNFTLKKPPFLCDLITIPPALHDLIRLEQNQIYLHSTHISVANWLQLATTEVHNSYHIYSSSVGLYRYGMRHTVNISMKDICHNTIICNNSVQIVIDT